MRSPQPETKERKTHGLQPVPVGTECSNAPDRADLVRDLRPVSVEQRNSAVSSFVQVLGSVLEEAFLVKAAV